MLFLKYLWSETIFRLFIPVIICSGIWLVYLLTLDLPLPWVLIPIMTILGGAVIFLVMLLLIIVCIKIYEVIWDQGYLEWKKTQGLPPTHLQEELIKINKILARYKIEVALKKNNSAAAKIYEEYQLVLALSDGIKVFDDIQILSYIDCLKDYDELG